jgi:hypothetical protein
MKMRATIELEYEADERQTNPQHILQVALTRAVGGLPYLVEYGAGNTAVPTGIKRGRSPSTTKVTVVESAIVDE